MIYARILAKKSKSPAIFIAEIPKSPAIFIAEIPKSPAITTGVENVQGDNVQSTKVIENGVLYIIRDGVRYNAQGQIVK
ncbi:MAG: hypothetical protein IKG86_04740 [Paludibacteraceae bacterium]|nr:hypothetical protein [Paludibacteraceae bacterium]